MHKYTHAMKLVFCDLTVAYQQGHSCTNIQMADLFAMSTRAYGNLKSGESGLSAVALCAFLAHVPEKDRAQIVLDLVNAIKVIEENGLYEA